MWIGADTQGIELVRGFVRTMDGYVPDALCGIDPKLLRADARPVYERSPYPRPSPVFARNWAARNLPTGDILLFAIEDGARIFSDRLYAATTAAPHLGANDANKL